MAQPLRYYNVSGTGSPYIGFIDEDNVYQILLFQPWSELTERIYRVEQRFIKLDVNQIINACTNKNYPNTLDDPRYKAHIKAALEQLANE